MALARAQAAERAAEAEDEELELEPTETAPDGTGEMGGRPTLPFGRAVDHPAKHPATFQRTTPAAPSRYCPKCYVQLPLAARDRCTNCGATLRKT